MKKLLIANAVLLACGAATAQSSVTLFGIADVNVGYVTRDAGVGDTKHSRVGLGGHGRSTSRLGFRGTEDLGGGLKAGFWLEGEINVDDGGSGLNFRRRSIVNLAGDFGEIRLGRDLLPSYNALGGYDIWNSTGVGFFQALTKNWLGANTAGPDDSGVRADNLIVYNTPDFNGFKASVGYAFDEKRIAVGTGNNVSDKVGRYVGGYLRYANGPVSVSVTGAQQKTGVLNVPADRDTYGVGGSYDLGVVKLGAIFSNTTYKPDGAAKLKFDSYALNGAIPVGSNGVVNLSYALYDQKAIDAKAHHFAAGYDYNMSKRTTLYGIVAVMNNKDGSTVGLSARNVYTGGVETDKTQTGMQVGIRHSF